MLLPGCFQNHGNYVISLGQLCRWLGAQAEALGVEVYPGFAGAEVLYDDKVAVRGVATGDMGLTHDGQPGPNQQPGMELLAKYTLFAEGCRGHLGKQVEAKFDLRAEDGSNPRLQIGATHIARQTAARLPPSRRAESRSASLDGFHSSSRCCVTSIRQAVRAMASRLKNAS